MCVISHILRACTRMSEMSRRRVSDWLSFKVSTLLQGNKAPAGPSVSLVGCSKSDCSPGETWINVLVGRKDFEEI